MERKEYAARLDSNDNALQSPADFGYSVTPTTLTIKDTAKGKKSVVADLPAVLRPTLCQALGNCPSTLAAPTGAADQPPTRYGQRLECNLETGG
jgi:hypothetical protein